ncbi:hypothetical protein [Sphaerospermopsis aphanizomenoides]|nr:hypothetical protein [Sphaerospermopsis aphanizomenoides]
MLLVEVRNVGLNIQRFSFPIEITAKVARKILILLLVFIVGIIG